MGIKLGNVSPGENEQMDSQELTWINAVEIMMPVPNCLMTVMTTEFTDAKGSLTSSIGANTPIALVTSITNNVPIRRGMS